jgi:hypothetical protein
MVLTVGAFVQAYRAMRKGDHHRVQTMFRARVAFQALTVIAMVGGGMYYQADRHREREFWKRQRAEEAEEKKLRWLRELEMRDEEEKALQASLDKRRKRAAERQAGVAAEHKGGQETESKLEHASTATKGSAQAEGASDRPTEVVGQAQVGNEFVQLEKKQGTSFLGLGNWFGGGSKSS